MVLIVQKDISGPQTHPRQLYKNPMSLGLGAAMMSAYIVDF